MISSRFIFCSYKVSVRKQPTFQNIFRVFTLRLKKVMFNLNENNRIVMAQHPSDMRMGVNCLSGQVRMLGLDPANGDVYIFRRMAHFAGYF